MVPGRFSAYGQLISTSDFRGKGDFYTGKDAKAAHKALTVLLACCLLVCGCLPLRYALSDVFYSNSKRMETAYAEIPKFWDAAFKKYAGNVYAGKEPANAYEKALADHCIGEYGVCIDDVGGGRFRYLIAGKYTGGDVPADMVVCEFPRSDWAVFDCTGPIPGALQRLNTRVFGEWLPGNPAYELSGNATVEWYDCANGEMTDPDYRSAIWVPVKKKA